MVEFDSVADELEKAGFGIESVEASENILSVVFVKSETEDGNMPSIDVDGDVVDMYLTTYKFFAMTVDVAFGNGRNE